MSSGFVLQTINLLTLLNLPKVGFFVISSARMLQIIRLLQRLMGLHTSRRSLAFVKIEKNESSRQNSDGEKNESIVPKGSLPVYVGKDILTRFVIGFSVLSHPLLTELLDASAHEFGYEHKGALRIPCDVLLFERILNLINSRHPAL